MCGGGGSDPVAAQQAAEKANEERARQGIAMINSVFGIPDDTMKGYTDTGGKLPTISTSMDRPQGRGVGAMFGAIHNAQADPNSINGSEDAYYRSQGFKSKADYLANLQALSPTGSGEHSRLIWSTGRGGIFKPTTKLTYEQMQALPAGYAGWEKALTPTDTLYDKATANQGLVQGQLGTMRDQVMALLTDQLGQQKATQEQSTTNDLARRGLSGGSEDLGAQAQILDAFNKGTLKAGLQADTSVNDAKTYNDQARLNLINQVRAGLDSSSAIASAGSMMQNNMNKARTDNSATTVGNIFSQIGDLWNLKNYNAGQTAAMGQYGYPAASGSGINVNRPGSNGMIIH